MCDPKHLLYLEDDPSTRTAMAYLFQQEGWTVHSYASAEEAVVHLTHPNEIDIAILDVRLPGRGGDDFGRELRDKCPQTQIIFLTAETDLDKLKTAVPDSIAIRKPADPLVLLEILRCRNPALESPPKKLTFRPLAG